jgi:UDP-N-acetyl-D-mannosaminuronic acid dehydrogenase
MSRDLETILHQKGPLKKIGVIGMGYVGISTAAAFAACPVFDFVWGFQRNSSSSGYKIDLLNCGTSPFFNTEPALELLLRQVVRAGRFQCSSDFSRIAEVDAVTIAVETGFLDIAEMIVDYSPLEAALRTIGRYLTPGLLVVLESTVTPGTTEGWARQILEEESGLKAGSDFALAHAPERVMPGRLLQNIREYDRVVGGIDAASTARAVELFSPLMNKGKIMPTSAKVAEVTKTAENALRDLQIASANQLALYCEHLGVNFYEVKTAIDTLKGEGVTRALLFPGAGVGGHCLTKDSLHLERSVRLWSPVRSFPSGSVSLFLAARRVNDFMPKHMHALTVEALRKAGKSPRGAKITILGWAYLQNTNDARNTPAAPYRDLLLKDGMEVTVHDPYVMDYAGFPIFHDLDEAARGSDGLALITGHEHYKTLDLERIKQIMRGRPPLLVDGRQVVPAETAIRSGFVYMAVGRGDMNWGAASGTAAAKKQES